MDSHIVGLILCGGRSTRMKGVDKASLVYNGKPATTILYEALAPFCETVCLGNRADQADQPGHAGLPQVHDLYPDKGPLGSIVSAMQTFPGKALVVLGCDMPYVTKAVIRELLNKRNPAMQASAFLDTSGHLQPLAAIYESGFLPILEEHLAAGRLSPFRILEENPVERIVPNNASALANINTPDDKVRFDQHEAS